MRLLVLLAYFCVGLCFCNLATGGSTTLAIRDWLFTVNSRPVFLLGISYFAALGTPVEFVLRDLEDIEKFGFNWIRVWVTWTLPDISFSAVNHDGEALEPYLSKMRWLVEECDRRGLIVDLTLHRSRGGIRDQRAHMKALATIISRLHGMSNWYLDLANERNIPDARFVPLQELSELCAAVRKLRPNAILTASHAGDMQQEELENYLAAARIDFLSIHRPRHPQSPTQTAPYTLQLRSWLQALRRPMPVHYQEPFRRGYSADWQPKAEDFLNDLTGAIKAGAAGWCFHNGNDQVGQLNQVFRSFDMRKARLFNQLDTEERRFLQLLTETRFKQTLLDATETFRTTKADRP